MSDGQKWRCKTCRHVSGDAWRDMADRPRCRRCQYRQMVAVPNRRQVVPALLCKRVAIVED